MKYFKRILALTLSIVLLLPAVMISAEFGDIKESPNRTAIQLLSALGLIDSETEQYFYPDDEVSRGEACKIISGLKGDFFEQNGENLVYYEDVPTSHPYYQPITYCLKNRIISASEYFRPDETITLQEGLTMLVNLLGYAPVANASGGYPNGYMVTAMDIGLLKNLSQSTGKLTKGELAQLLYNSLFAELIESIVIRGDNTVEYGKSGKTLLSERDIYRVKGMVDANEKSSLFPSGTPAATGKFRIDNMEIFDRDRAGEKLLGYYTDVYYHEEDSGEKSLVYIEAINNKTTVIPSEDFVSLQSDLGQLIFKFDQNGTEKKLTAAKNAVILWNGKSIVASGTDFLKNFHTGEIVLVDNGSKEFDAGYGVILVKSYENFIVSNVSSDKIYFKTGSYRSHPYIEYDEEKTTVRKEGKEISFSDVKAGDAVSIAGNADGFDELEVHSQSESGEISEISDSDNGFVIGINGNLYDVAADCYMESNYRPGDNVLAVINFKGSIVYIGNEVSRKYGIVIGAEGGTEFEPLRVKLLTDTGKTTVYDCGEKIKFNEDQASGQAAVAAAIKNLPVQLVSYELNKAGTLTAINTASEPTGDLWEDRNRFTLHAIETNEVRATSVSLGEKIYTTDALVFQLAEPIAGQYDEDSFQVGKGTLIAGKDYKNIYSYDVKVNGCSQAIMILGETSDSFTSNSARSMLTVERVAETVNSDGEILKKIYGYEAGAEKECYISPNAKKVYTEHGFECDISRLGFGDILIYETDYTGNIQKYAIVYKEDAETKPSGRLLAVGSGYLYAQNMEILRGYAGMFDTKVFPVMTEQNGFVTTLLRTKEFKVPVVNRKKRTITLVSIDEVNKPGYGFAYPGDEIVARGNFGELYELVVYREQ